MITDSWAKPGGALQSAENPALRGRTLRGLPGLSAVRVLSSPDRPDPAVVFPRIPMRQLHLLYLRQSLEVSARLGSPSGKPRRRTEK